MRLSTSCLPTPRISTGKAFGQIVVQLPEDTLTANKMIAYLQEQGLTAEEVQL